MKKIILLLMIFSPFVLSAVTVTWDEGKVSPNPVNEMLFFSMDQELEILEIQLFDSSGSVLWTNKGGINQISFGDYTPGVYFLNVVSSSGSTVQKIIKN